MPIEIYHPKLKPRVEFKPMLTVYNGKLALVSRLYGSDDDDWVWALREIKDDIMSAGPLILLKQDEELNFKLKPLPDPSTF